MCAKAGRPWRAYAPRSAAPPGQAPAHKSVLRPFSHQILRHGWPWPRRTHPGFHRDNFRFSAPAGLPFSDFAPRFPANTAPPGSGSANSASPRPRPAAWTAPHPAPVRGTCPPPAPCAALRAAPAAHFLPLPPGYSVSLCRFPRFRRRARRSPGHPAPPRRPGRSRPQAARPTARAARTPRPPRISAQSAPGHTCPCRRVLPAG